MCQVKKLSWGFLLFGTFLSWSWTEQLLLGLLMVVWVEWSWGTWGSSHFRDSEWINLILMGFNKEEKKKNKKQKKKDMKKKKKINGEKQKREKTEINRKLRAKKFIFSLTFCSKLQKKKLFFLISQSVSFRMNWFAFFTQNLECTNFLHTFVTSRSTTAMSTFN